MERAHPARAAVSPGLGDALPLAGQFANLAAPSGDRSGSRGAGGQRPARLKGAAAFSAAENQTAVGVPTASDPDDQDSVRFALSGVAKVGRTVTADAWVIRDQDGLTNVSYRCQRIRVAESESEIAGATEAGCIATSEDEGLQLKVRVEFTDDGGNAEALTSAPTGESATPKAAELERAVLTTLYHSTDGPAWTDHDN